MRALFLLLALSSFLGAAEMEYIKLKDGRTFIGLYNEDAGTIEITTGNAKATVKLKADDIVHREPLAAKPPERDFVAEARKLLDQEVAAEKAKIEAQHELEEQVARQKAAREKQAADAAETVQRQLELNNRIRQIKLEGADAERRAAVAAALHEADEAERQRKAKAVADQQLDAQLAAEAAELDRQRSAAAAEQHRQFVQGLEAHQAKDRLAEIQRRQAAEAAASRASRVRQEEVVRGLVIIGILVALVLLWLVPILVAMRRDFYKQGDIGLICGITIVSSIISSAAFHLGLVDFLIVIITTSIAGLGWLAAFIWVLVASKSPETHLTPPVTKADD